MTGANRNEVAYYEYDACLPACATLTYSAGRSFGRGPQLWGAPPASGGDIMTTRGRVGTWQNPYCFATKERDYEAKSGLIYFGFRYYSPEVERS